MVEESSFVHTGDALTNQNTKSSPNSSNMVWKARRESKNNKQQPSRNGTSSLNNRRRLKSCLKPSASLLSGSGSVTTSSTVKDFSLTSGYVKYSESQSSTSTNNSKRSRELSSCPSGCSSDKSRSDSTSRHSEAQSASGSRNSGSRSSRSRHSDPHSTTSDIRVAEHGHRSPIPKEKSVHFKEIHMREYVRVIGDNPSCSVGPPIS